MSQTARVWRWSTEFPPSAGSKRAKPWTAEEIQTIRDLAERGHPASEIARALKRSEGAVRYKARWHGVPLVRDAESSRA